MASSINLKNSGGSTLAITHSDSKGGKTIIGTDIVTSVATINDFPTVGIQDGDTVIVKEEGRGGTFILKPGAIGIANGGTIFASSDPLYYWYRQYSGAVNVKWFGADNTGATEVTTKIQAALDAAASKTTSLFVPKGIYLIDNVVVEDGVKSVIMDGVFRGASTVGDNGVVSIGTVLQHCNSAIFKLKIDMSNGGRTAVKSFSSQNCVFNECYIYGFTNHATLNHYGLLFTDGSNYNTISNCNIVGFDTPTQRGLLIDFLGTSLNDYGGFFTGTVTGLDNPCVGNIIINNHLQDGSYGVNLLGCSKTIVKGNYISNSNHRSIYCANSTEYSVITDNVLYDFLSTGVLLSYGSNNNLVANNQMHIPAGGAISGEAAVNINTGSSYNVVEGNMIDSSTNYGVYIATDSSYNIVKGNTIKNSYVCAIAVENDWVDILPANASFSRSNYADPTDLDPLFTSWTFNDLVGTVIENNTILHGYPARSICGIYIAQIKNTLAGATETKTLNTRVSGNSIVTMTDIGEVFTVYENTSGKLDGIIVNDNTYSSSTTTIDFRATTPTGSVEFQDIGLTRAEGNGIFNDIVDNDPFKFTDGDLTPDVSGYISGKQYFQFQNTALTNVTYFDGGYEGQEITFRADSNTQIIYGGGTIRTKGLANTGSLTSNYVMSFKKFGAIWYETARNF